MLESDADTDSRAHVRVRRGGAHAHMSESDADTDSRAHVRVRRGVAHAHMSESDRPVTSPQAAEAGFSQKVSFSEGFLFARSGLVMIA